MLPGNAFQCFDRTIHQCLYFRYRGLFAVSQLFFFLINQSSQVSGFLRQPAVNRLIIQLLLTYFVRGFKP